MSATGPFIVTQRRPEDWRCECGDLNRAHEWCCYRCGAGAPDNARERTAVSYREAFATLEEAKAEIVARVFPRQPEQGMRPPEWDEPFVALATLPEAGGTITLPNGDVIEVEATTWGHIFHDLPLLDRYVRGPESADALLAAWNAEYGIGIGEEA